MAMLYTYGGFLIPQGSVILAVVAIAASAVSMVGAVEVEEEPFNENPEYNYAFAVEDKEEKVTSLKHF